MRECEHHGPYQSRLIDAPFDMGKIETGCQLCIRESHAKSEQFRERSQHRLRSEKLKGLITAAAIPAKYADASIDAYRTEFQGEHYARRICETYLKTWATQRMKGGSLVFCGKPGTGKTHLACAIGNDVMASHGGTVVYGTVPQIVGLVRESFRDGSAKSERQVIKDLLDPDLLILDEIGAQSGSDYELRTLFEIINGRYQAGRPMLLVSNLTPEQMEKTLGERVMDRFRECAIIVPFNWASFRGRRQGELC
ncbi:DNA replication protein DnaC [Dyella jiangningensis]|nr:phage DNA replication protein (predicted replicative helicase loader) [Dyella sp. AtDHG13]SDJ54932.1 DNA replication protein DnaC [Dyella jiangningensis]